MNDETRAFITREIERRPEIADLVAGMETAAEGGDDDLTELLAPIFTLDEAPEVVRLRARVAELEGLLGKALDLSNGFGRIAAQYKARAESAENQVALVLELMATAPETPPLLGDGIAAGMWGMGWDAFRRHLQLHGALRPIVPDGVTRP